MTDVTSQMEANGLPTQFESTSNQPEVMHAITNADATISNAEASQIKQNAPGIEVTTTAQPVQPVESTTEPQPEPSLSANDVAINDAATESEAAQVNGHSEQTSAPQLSDAPPVSESVTEPVTEPVTDSVVPPPSDVAVAQPVVDAPQPIVSDPAQPATLPDQAPISNLRTSPHSDALDASAVAKIEAAKHEIDNNPEPAPLEPSPVAPAVPSVPQEDTVMTEQPPASPPAAETLPATQTSEPNGTIVPSVEAVTLDAAVEKPAEPAPTPAVPAPTSTADQEMTDAPHIDPPQQAVKHDRDEDAPEEPSAKRQKTDEESEDTPLAQVSAPNAVSSTPAPAADGDDVVTPVRLAWMKKTISNLKKSSASLAFRLPVDYIALNIPHYPNIITNPMDLHTIDVKLKEGKYQSVAAFTADFNQIVTNCVTFNGAEHAVTQQAKKMESSFNSQMSKLPAVSDPEPSKVVKPKLEPVRAPPPRRQSVTAKAASPKATSPATFAPDPNGMPLIRRDSAIDGRPKRAIVPPKRNSDFGGARPRKKKYELELRFCDEVLKQITATKNWTANQYFMHPVDPVALNIPTYFQIIKKPMDLTTIKGKLDSNQYERAKEFEEDVRLIFKNCYKFNQPGDYVYQRGEELERLFNKEWEKKQDWIAAREPDSEPASVKSEDESEEEEEAESDDETTREDEIAKLQAQLEAMQNQMLELKSKKKSPDASKSKKGTDKKAKKPTSKFPGLQKPEKAKKPAKKPKAERERFVSFAEKQYISNGIAMLPERPMQEALRIIQTSVPQLTNSESGEIELDIEEVPNHALLKLLEHVKKYAGPPPEESKEPEYSAPAATTNKKKSKSLTKHEQEAQIASLKGQLQTYDKGSSPDAMQSVENGADDSDNDSNEESEEE